MPVLAKVVSAVWATPGNGRPLATETGGAGYGGGVTGGAGYGGGAAAAMRAGNISTPASANVSAATILRNMVAPFGSRVAQPALRRPLWRSNLANTPPLFITNG